MDKAVPAVLITLGLGAVVAAAVYTTSGGPGAYSPKSPPGNRTPSPKSSPRSSVTSPKSPPRSSATSPKSSPRNSLQRESSQLAPTPQQKTYQTSVAVGSSVPTAMEIDRIGARIEWIKRNLNKDKIYVITKEMMMKNYARSWNESNDLLAKSSTEKESKQLKGYKIDLESLKPKIKAVIVGFLNKRIVEDKLEDSAREINDFLREYDFISDAEYNANKRNIDAMRR